METFESGFFTHPLQIFFTTKVSISNLKDLIFHRDIYKMYNFADIKKIVQN